MPDKVCHEITNFVWSVPRWQKDWEALLHSILLTLYTYTKEQTLGAHKVEQSLTWGYKESKIKRHCKTRSNAWGNLCTWNNKLCFSLKYFITLFAGDFYFIKIDEEVFKISSFLTELFNEQENINFFLTLQNIFVIPIYLKKKSIAK